MPGRHRRHRQPAGLPGAAARGHAHSDPAWPAPDRTGARMKALTAPGQLAQSYDLVVVGAGPAGLSAATTAAQHGLDVLLVDENPAPGGQIYRAITSTPISDRAVLGQDYWRGADIVARFERAPASYAARCTLWSVTPHATRHHGQAFEVGLSQGGCARLIDARQLILATGAQERPFPIPGWTLPGVMSAGAAQIALKSAAIVPAGRTVVAGCGPLLYLLARQLAAAGAEIVALLDTTPRRNGFRAAAALPDFLRSPYALAGLKLLAGLHLNRRLRFVGGVPGLSGAGQDRLAAVTFVRDGRTARIDCDTLLLHQGLIPGVNLSNAAGCAHDFSAAGHCWLPRLDDWFTSSVPGIAIPGDGAGMAGATSAAFRGETAALAVAERLGRIALAGRERAATPLRAQLARALRGRRFLDLLYRPAAQFLAPPQDDTIVGRCEEVTAGQIRDSAKRLGVTGPNRVKAVPRSGRRPWQGGLWGPTGGCAPAGRPRGGQAARAPRPGGPARDGGGHRGRGAVNAKRRHADVIV